MEMPSRPNISQYVSIVATYICCQLLRSGESFCTRRGDSSDASTASLHLETVQDCGFTNAIFWKPVKIHRGGPNDTVIGSASMY
jgi:hypothetical protein